MSRRSAWRKIKKRRKGKTSPNTNKTVTAQVVLKVTTILTCLSNRRLSATIVIASNLVNLQRWARPILVRRKLK